MNAEQFLNNLYHDIWQGNDLSKIDSYYAKDVNGVISVSDDNKLPKDIHLNYDSVVKQAQWQSDNYKELVFDFKTIVAGENHISAICHSSGVDKKSGEQRQYRVAAIWQLDQDNKINHVSGVMTPFYQFEH